MFDQIKKVLIGIFFSIATIYVWGSNIPTSNQVGAMNMPTEIAPIQAPFAMPQLVRPTFPDRTVNIAKKGAKLGKSSTNIIQKAIDDLSRKGGGTVIIPPGKWQTGRIILKSNINLHLEKGAELHFSGEIKDYLPVVLTRNEGVELYSLGAFIYANQADNIALTGEGKLFGPSKECEIYRSQMQGKVVEEFINNGHSVEERVYDGKDNKPVFLPMFFHRFIVPMFLLKVLHLKRLSFGMLFLYIVTE